MIFLSMKNVGTLRVRHTKISEAEIVRLVEIQKRHWQYLIERLIARAENLDMRDEIMKILT